MNRNGCFARSARRWIVPRLSGRVAAVRLDAAAAKLEKMAQALLASVPRVLKNVTRARAGAVARSDYDDLQAVEDRAWRISCGAFEGFCIVDAISERELVSLIVGPMTPHRPTDLERKIVGEAVVRLFSVASGQAHAREEVHQRPVPPSWRCLVEMSEAEGAAFASIALFTPCLPVPAPAFSRPEINNVPLMLRATMPSISSNLSAVTTWRSGSLVPIVRLREQTPAILYAGGKRVARAELGTLFGDRALRLVALAPSDSS